MLNDDEGDESQQQPDRVEQMDRREAESSAIAVNIASQSNGDGESGSSAKLVETGNELSSSSSSDSSRAPFPWRILIVLYFVIVSDGMAMQIIGPFLSELCTTRWGISEENVGFAVRLRLRHLIEISRLRTICAPVLFRLLLLPLGKLFGAYSLAAFLTSFLIGYLSDKIGRKKLMLIGLLSAAICTVGVVMVPSYWMAVGLRFIVGATNANVALSKAVISDVTKGENRAIGFAYLGASFSFSRLVASIIGGLAAGHFIPWGFLATNPYVLPSLIGTLFNAASFVLAVLFIPETLRQPQQSGKRKNDKGSESLSQGIRYIASDRTLRNLILGFALNSVSNGSLILALYVYYTLEVAKHSLGFTPLEMGLTFSWFGGVALIFQTVFFERLLRRLRIVRLYGLGLAVLCVATVLVPTGGLIYWWFGKNTLTEIAAYAHTSVTFVGLAIGFMTCLPVMGTMISNAADPERQGITQGTTQSIAALFRALGPLVSGAIFSLSVSISFPFLLFWFLAVVNVLCLILLRALPEEDLGRVSQEREKGRELEPLTAKSSGKDEVAAIDVTERK